MAETIVTSVQELLTEEKWTRATISNYSKAQFEEFAEIVAKICDANEIDEAKAICDEHLAHTKNSIIALRNTLNEILYSQTSINSQALLDLMGEIEKKEKNALEKYELL
mgnify:CR=1 FL=1